MSKKTKLTPEQRAAELARIETLQSEAIPAETTVEQLEGEIERAKNKKLREVGKDLRDNDRKRRKSVTGVLAIVRRNKHKPGFFPKGSRSIQTRTGLVGVRKKNPQVVTPKGMDNKALVALAKSFGIADHCIKTYESFNKTLFRHAVEQGKISKDQMEAMGLKIVQGETEYQRLKRVRTDKKKNRNANKGKAR